MAYADAQKRCLWTAVLMSAISVTVAVFPLLIIQPFRHQSPTPLRLALFAFRIGPAITDIAIAAVVLLAAFCWRQRRQAYVLVPCFVFSVMALALANMNVFEKMFHPDSAALFEAANTAHLADADMILSVTLNGQTHGYPIRAIAYHHVINDTVGGQPIVATY